MKANRAIWPIVTVARLLEVFACGFYAWLERKPSAHARSDADLLSRNRAIYTHSRGTYQRVHGRPRTGERDESVSPLVADVKAHE